MIQKRKTKKVGLAKGLPVPRLKKKKRVHCKFCQKLVLLDEAHRHDGGWVGPECWDERLRPTS